MRDVYSRVARFQHRHGGTFVPLLFNHLFESLAFVPIMIGVLMFLFEFFEDQVDEGGMSMAQD